MYYDKWSEVDYYYHFSSLSFISYMHILCTHTHTLIVIILRHFQKANAHLIIAFDLIYPLVQKSLLFTKGREIQETIKTEGKRIKEIEQHKYKNIN